MIYETIRPAHLEDLIEINGWYRERGHVQISADLMPPQGFMVPGIAAGFLVRTSMNIAFLENFASNPKAAKQDRHKALDLIAEKLIKGARSSGIRGIYAISKHPFIFELCKKHSLAEIAGLKIFGGEI